MRKRRRTADDFVRDMKAKQHHGTPGDTERKTSEGQSEGRCTDPRTGRRMAAKLAARELHSQ
jgi:hypothetical protein